jgi:hypothetical protein
MAVDDELQPHLTLDFGAYLDSLQRTPLFFDNACSNAISTSHRRNFIAGSGVWSKQIGPLVATTRETPAGQAEVLFGS